MNTTTIDTRHQQQQNNNRKRRRILHGSRRRPRPTTSSKIMMIIINLFSIVAVNLLLGSNNNNIRFVSARKCYGPETAEDLRDTLWAGSNSMYQKRTRPSMAQWKALAVNEKDDSDIEIRGSHNDVPPDTVRVQLHILSVTNIDQKRGEFQIMAWFRQKWNDPRLRYNDTMSYECFKDEYRLGYSLQDLEGIWKPDITIQNQVQHNMNAGSFWLYPNGDVAVAKSIQLTVSCAMDLRDFPKDIQKCKVLVGTWLEDASDIVLDFYEDMDPVTVGDVDDISFDDDVVNDDDYNHHPSLLLESKDAKPYAKDWGGSGEWHIKCVHWKSNNHKEYHRHGVNTQKESLVQFSFQFERNSRYYVDFVIMPSVLFVIIGWASFFISRGAAPARVTMTMIAFLTNINFLSAQLNSLPRDSSSIWLLRFLTMSTCFTFYTVIEYVLCNYLHRVESRVDAAHERARELKKRRYGSICEQMHASNTSRDMDFFSCLADLEEATKADNTFEDDDCCNEQKSDHCNGETESICSTRHPNNNVLRRQSISIRSLRSRRMSLARRSSFRIKKPKQVPTSKQDLINIGFKYKIDLLLLDHRGKMIIKDQYLDIFSRIMYPICYMIAAVALVVIVEV